MRAALIPPRGYERSALQSYIHLVLPLAPLVSNQDYINTYLEARRRGDYIILDNGCAEGQLVNGDVLLKFAQTIGAHEIVAPDVMGEARRTWWATKTFLNAFDEAHDYNIMGVMQGNTPYERHQLLERFARFDCISTIGVPKVLVKENGDETRLTEVEFILNEYHDRFKIHLLGLNKAWPQEVFLLPWPREVRSCDSAQPYKLAEIGKLLTLDNAWAPRRIDYFTRVSQTKPRILQANIRTFQEWARKHEG